MKGGEFNSLTTYIKQTKLLSTLKKKKGKRKNKGYRTEKREQTKKEKRKESCKRTQPQKVLNQTNKQTFHVKQLLKQFFVYERIMFARIFA